MGYRNHEHYADPTAGRAIGNMTRDVYRTERRNGGNGMQWDWEDLANAIISQITLPEEPIIVKGVVKILNFSEIATK